MKDAEGMTETHAFINAMRANKDRLIEAGKEYLAEAGSERVTEIVGGITALMREACVSEKRPITRGENMALFVLAERLSSLYLEGKISAESRAYRVLMIMSLPTVPGMMLEAQLAADLMACCRKIASETKKKKEETELLNPESFESAIRYGWKVHHVNGRMTILRLDPDDSNRHLVPKTLFKNFIREMTTDEIMLARTNRKQKKSDRRENDAAYRRAVRGHNEPMLNSWGKINRK